MIPGFVYNRRASIASLDDLCNSVRADAFGYLHCGIEQLIRPFGLLSEYRFQWQSAWHFYNVNEMNLAPGPLGHLTPKIDEVKIELFAANHNGDIPCGVSSESRPTHFCLFSGFGTPKVNHGFFSLLYGAR